MVQRCLLLAARPRRGILANHGCSEELVLYKLSPHNFRNGLLRLRTPPAIRSVNTPEAYVGNTTDLMIPSSRALQLVPVHIGVDYGRTGAYWTGVLMHKVHAYDRQKPSQILFQQKPSRGDMHI